MKARVVSLFLSVFLVSQSYASNPSEWHENDWVKFIDTAVSGTLGDAYSVVGGRFPLVDTYSALSAAGSAVKPGLQVWLRKKNTDAYINGDYEKGDRYHAFYSCLTWKSCDELKRIQRQDDKLKRTQRQDDRPNTKNSCTCEDWDKNGQYGVVLNGNTVLAPNVGSLWECNQYSETLGRCSGSIEKKESGGTNLICTCEDWDKDGRFGVVLNGRVLRSNVGTRGACLKYAQTLGSCVE